MKQLIAPVAIIVILIVFFVIVDRKEFSRHDNVQMVQNEPSATNRKPTVSVPEAKPITEVKPAETKPVAESESIVATKPVAKAKPVTEKQTVKPAEPKPVAQTKSKEKLLPTAVPVVSAEEAKKLNAEAEMIRAEPEKITRNDAMEFSLANGVTLDMVIIEGGTFTMGDASGVEDETPHRVIITKDYYLGKTEVTQAQWRAVMGNDPSHFEGDNRPMENVSWNDAMEFCDKLNSMGKAPKGYKFTLPTEAQWEYAARGGNGSRGYKYSGSNDIGDVAWYGYEDNSGRKTHEVAMKKPNELGIYDMSGNVWEWCLDWYGAYHGDAVDPQGASSSLRSHRVFRGGSWGDGARMCRSAYRGSIVPGYRSSILGFRLALVLGQ